jgi:endonuclease/exonuclease/phosphatase family metal-dependent hydrolase
MLHKASTVLAVLLLGGIVGLTSGPAAAATPAPAAPQVLDAFPNRVATFNVCNPCGRVWPARHLRNIEQQIVTYRPQVIALQEICAGEVDAVRSDLENYYGLTYHVAHGDVLNRLARCFPYGRAFGNAILSAAPVTDVVNHTYQAGGSEARGYVAVTTTVNGQSTRVFGTHLAQFGSQSAVRALQVQDLAATAAQYQNAIVLGDFNSTPNAPELNDMWAFFQDADPNCAPPANSGCKITHPGAGKKFDYIWLHREAYTPPGVGSHDNFSDHNLVHADLS